MGVPKIQLDLLRICNDEFTESVTQSFRMLQECADLIGIKGKSSVEEIKQEGGKENGSKRKKKLR